jgi:hypothetical protein
MKRHRFCAGKDAYKMGMIVHIAVIMESSRDIERTLV